MGLLHKDLQERNVVYDELIKHFKDKIVTQNKDSSKNEWIMETYDNEVKKADRGDAYRLESLMSVGFGGLAVGLMAGGIAIGEPGVIAAASSGALASAGISLYNYIRFKRLSLGRGLGTRMFYAEMLQKIIEEDDFPYPFNSGELEDYEQVEGYVNVLKQLEDKGMSNI